VGKQHVAALKDVSLEIREGEFIAFTGPSGSGKSTLLQIIGGLDKPNEGTIVINGQNIAKLSDRALSKFRNQTVGFVFQFFYLQPFLSLQTNLAVPGIFARMKPQEFKARAQELAQSVGLGDRLSHLPKELSGGQMQRAAIARALLNKPKLILADEPTGNLDSTNGEAIIELFDKVRKEFGTTIVVVTHDPKVAAHADREIVLRDGRITS
jgi:putative ABC transport system ATP-binding protein